MYVEIGNKLRKNNLNLFKLAENDKFLYEVSKKNDKGYKYLFSIKKYFIEFLKGFVKEEWTYDVKEENIEQVTGEYDVSIDSRHKSVEGLQ